MVGSGEAGNMVLLLFAHTKAAADILTNPALDPDSKTPEFKFAAVKVVPAV